MRSEELSVLKSDLFLSTIMVGAGLLSEGVAAVRAVPAVAATIGALTAGTVYLAEHDVVPGVYPEVATVAAFLLTLGVGVGFALGLSQTVAVVSAAGLTGGGVGIALYRFVFGVLWPVPTYRLEKGSEPEERVEPE